MRRLALVAVALTAACGSTVQVQGTAQLGGTGGELGTGTTTTGTGVVPGTSVPGSVGSSPLPGVGAAVPGSTSGSAAGGPSSSGGAGPTAPGTVAQGTVPAAGPGYTAKEIRLGFSTSNDAAKALGAAGLGVAVADQEELVKTWLAKVNAEGGIAGRKVVPVFYDYAATGDVQTSDQAACNRWTQDTLVFAASGVRAGTSGSGDNLTPCLARKGVAWLNGGGDAQKWTQYLDAMYSTLNMSRTREARVLVESLAQQGFFTAGAKIGVIINDNQDDMSRAVKQGMEPALAKLGRKIDKRFVVSLAQTESSNAELQMAAAGITHVLFAAPGGAGASSFMQAAESQGRTYRYGISSQDAPGLTVQALAPANQAKNAVGYGYQPGLDVDASNQPTPTPAMRACFDHYRSKGFQTSSLNQAAMGLICDSVNLLRRGLAGQTNPTRASFAAVVNGLGGSFGAASTFSTLFTPTQHDGIGGYRDLYYGTDCSCFRYRGPVRPIR
ncbi:MAG: hypothetical protein JWN55_608 [Frankiales bacterium]|nr:hypothetical protein [Frankiales bacterium]